MTSEADRLIKLLDLAPHPEGGYFRETLRDPCRRMPAGPSSTAILFSAQGRRGVALAPGGCRRSLALLSRRAAGTADRQRRLCAGRAMWMKHRRRRSWCRPTPGNRRRAWANTRWSVARWRLGFEFAHFEIAPGRIYTRKNTGFLPPSRRSRWRGSEACSRASRTSASGPLARSAKKGGPTWPTDGGKKETSPRPEGPDICPGPPRWRARRAARRTQERDEVDRHGPARQRHARALGLHQLDGVDLLREGGAAGGGGKDPFHAGGGVDQRVEGLRPDAVIALGGGETHIHPLQIGKMAGLVAQGGIEVGVRYRRAQRCGQIADACAGRPPGAVSV